MNKEILDFYSEEGEHLGAMEKKKLHEKMRKEYSKKKRVTVRMKHVYLILMNSKGKLILQKRRRMSLE